MSTQDKLAQAVPQGWKLVPVEPTHDMICAGNDSDPDSLDWVGPEACWAAMLAAAPQPEAAPEDVDLPDVEGMAHSACQEALSFGLNHDVFHRWMRAVMDKTVAAMLAAAPQPEVVQAENLGRCCYGGRKPKSDCASCGAWLAAAPQPEAVQVADEFDQIVEQLAEVSCPRCLGTQAIPAMSDNGPDAYETEVCCDHCEGSGTAKGAYEALAKFKQRAITELTQLRHFRWHTKEQEKKSAALAAQQAEQKPDAFQRALEVRAAQGWKIDGGPVPVLYTDEINDRQVCRDDVWLCKTEHLASQQAEREPLSREQAIAIARKAAVAARDERGNPAHNYLPMDSGERWNPHEWVVDAIMAAAAAGRSSK